ncbi:CBS domain-containing protein [Nocardioides convexus]|uniref:CBS domain-containing protein n=1 Tax=Nocardioides convexus TaxID=2712224 RepID=UPI0024181913|nr:CBS domain-containing protein [Nocardioides convexus]
MVSADGTSLDGIVSERDVVRRLHSDGTVINNVVSAIMTTSVHTCSPEDDLDEVLQVMTEGRFRHIPAAADGEVVGIVSIGDLVKHKIDQAGVRARPDSTPTCTSPDARTARRLLGGAGERGQRVARCDRVTACSARACRRSEHPARRSPRAATARPR